jgi:hypothetical protein
MSEPGSATQATARAAAEEILRIIFGDDLEGCTVGIDPITEVISAAMSGQAQFDRAIADLNEKAYEAIRILSTPPANGASLNPDELRSLLGDRLDKIQAIVTKVIGATESLRNLNTNSDNAAPDSIE